jgi:hypothetical protein
MKKLLLMSMITSSFLVASVFASDSVQSIRENVFLGMHQIKLPDGLTAFGESAAVIGDPFCDVERSPLDDDHSVSTFIELGDFARRLKDPTCLKNNGWFSFATFTHDYYSPKEILDIYRSLANKASHLNLNALMFFETILRTGQISGVKIPGLNPQPERAALFRELYEWRNGWRADAQHALEAIRIERERLEAIAVEEEAPRTTAESARLEVAKKTQESGLRYRKSHGATPTIADPEATVKDPLLSRKVQ